MVKVRIERKTDWQVRPAKPEEDNNLISFYHRTTWKDKDVTALYNWKFKDNTFGRALAVLGENSENAIIGTCVFMPWKLCMNNKELPASQWVDMIIELAYRGQEISAAMLKHGLDTFKQQGAGLCFAFPNTNGIIVHKKNNGTLLGDIIRYVKPLNSGYLVERLVKNKMLQKPLSFIANLGLRLVSAETYYFASANTTFKETAECTQEYTQLFTNFQEAHPNIIMTRKDAAYLIWKYLKTPNKTRKLYALSKNGALIAWAVLEISKDTGYIVDMLASDETSIKSLICQIIRHFRKNNLSASAFVSLENNIYLSTLGEFGFIKRPDTKCVYMYVDDNLTDKNTVLDSRNWFLTIGDCDIEAV